MKIQTGWLRSVLLVVAAFASTTSVWAAGDLPTKFTNRNSVANTRHNLTQRQLEGGGPNGAVMDPYRNNYGEVCVYCHTPHGANPNVTAPLWNRTVKTTTYVTYDQLGTTTLTQAVTQPGPNSLACLSCHDGQVGVDSVINMPGSGGYNASQASIQNDAFLDTWSGGSSSHMGLTADGCLACHSAGAGAIGKTATDFTVFAIGTDLRNDHPVGVRFPTVAPGIDFNPPNVSKLGVAFFDRNGNQRPDPNEIRVYDSGEGYEVECASCHDPHGVPSAGPGSQFNPTFLRVANTGSAVCLTCHSK